MPQTITAPDGVASSPPPAPRRQAWDADPQKPVDMPAHTPPADLAGHEPSQPVVATPPRQPVERVPAPVRESMDEVCRTRPSCPLQVTCEPIGTECEACADCCADCCACVGVSLLAISVGVWVCGCSVATAEGMAIAGGSTVGASFLAHALKDCAYVPCCSWA